MSLIVWYPFTKDIENKGLSNITSSASSGLELINCNKFGTSLYFPGSKSIAMNNFPAEESFGKTSWSISFWCKFQNDGQRAIILGGFKNVDEVMKGINIEINSGSTTSNKLRFWWYVGNNNRDVMSNVICDANTWVYVTITYDGTTLKFYKNGEFVESYNYSLTFEDVEANWYIGRDNRSASGKTFIGNLHDFRIYNHCLSVKEIKELAKGLILHHDLKGYGAGENILPENWLNSGTLEFDESIDRYVHVRDITTTSESYLAIGRTAQVEKSTQYTFSTWVWINDNVRSIEFFWLSDTEENKKTGTSWVNVTSTSTTGDTTSINNKLIPNKWNYVSWTFTTKSDDYTGYIRYDNNGSKTEGEHAILKACCPKLEKGSKATPYIPYSLTNTDIEEDLSGNGFNGTRQGVTFTPDSPRYYMSTEFDANKDLLLDRIFHQNDEVSNLSVSIWANFSASYVSGTNNCLWNLNQNQFFRIERTSNTNINCVAYMGSATQNFAIGFGSTIAANTWYHIVTTFDKGIFKLYVNGTLASTTDKTGVATTLKCANSTSRWSLGDYTQTNNKFTGKLSDFRIYAKTLTADDVKELYQTSALIDKSGKMYCGEFVEE